MKKKHSSGPGTTRRDAVILGGGLAGLSSGYVLSNAGLSVDVYEADQVVGGLSKTIEWNGFRFDLGGHRFYTKDAEINDFVQRLMGEELQTVHRSSRIYMREKYFDYPLKPFNAMFGLGVPTTVRILADYCLESAGRLFRKRDIVSLEDWVVSRFGRTMFGLYFKEYSEKVWGIDCKTICATWVAQRIKGLSLAQAVKNALFKFSGRDLPTLTDTFSYPRLGIGRLAERMRDEIVKRNHVCTGTPVVSINRSDRRIESVTVETSAGQRTVRAESVVSSIPITKLVSLLDPPAPAAVLDRTARLKFRDLVVVAVMVDRPQVTDQTWIYIPEQKIPFGRIHEPTNWSRDMAPPGKSLLVMEFFSFRNDPVWRTSDQELVRSTVDNLVGLGFLGRHEVIDSKVVRVPNAYPLFEVGYRDHASCLYDYLTRFGNLFISGRSGMFQYYNMDVALRSGVDTANRIISRPGTQKGLEPTQLVLANV